MDDTKPIADFRIVGPCEEQYFEYEIYEPGAVVPLCACRNRDEAEWIVKQLVKCREQKT